MMWFFPVLLLFCLASADKHHHCKMVTGEERVCKMVLQPSQKEVSGFCVFIRSFV